VHFINFVLVSQDEEGLEGNCQLSWLIHTVRISPGGLSVHNDAMDCTYQKVGRTFASCVSQFLHTHTAHKTPQGLLRHPCTNFQGPWARWRLTIMLYNSLFYQTMLVADLVRILPCTKPLKFLDKLILRHLSKFCAARSHVSSWCMQELYDSIAYLSMLKFVTSDLPGLRDPCLNTATSCMGRQPFGWSSSVELTFSKAYGALLPSRSLTHASVSPWPPAYSNRSIAWKSNKHIVLLNNIFRQKLDDQPFKLTDELLLKNPSRANKLAYCMNYCRMKILLVWLLNLLILVLSLSSESICLVWGYHFLNVGSNPGGSV
jgi:hypothetical protein